MRTWIVCSVVFLVGWRSPLYPADWQPGLTDAEGHFLHDFSFAGYRAGAEQLPDAPPGATYDVITYGADPSGAADSTAAIQHALDDAGRAGGGVVYLPPGTYRVRPPEGAVHALYIGKSRVVLRGAGPAQTRIFNDEPVMRDKRIIGARPDPANHFVWYWGATDTRALAEDAAATTTQLRVVDAAGYQAGDWIVVRADPTEALIAEHGMTGTWRPEDIGGPIFYRRLVAVDAATNTLTLDVPTRYPLRLRDNARINRTAPHLEQIGIEHLAIGNRQNTRAGTDDDDHGVPGTGGYEMHNSFAIYFTHVVDGWIRDVATYRPDGNTADVHLLSNGLRLDGSRFVTVTGCNFQRPQYKGAGGNGYLFVMTGSENLITESHAERGRHNFTFGLMYVSGNVIHRSSAKDSRLPVDFHMHLSMANLIDNLALDNDSIEAVQRTCCNHGHSTTQSVIWNTHGIRYPSGQILDQFIVESAQFGHGYVIGTRGAASKVRIGSDGATAPRDYVEGIAGGDNLEPASLFEDQVQRRLGPGPSPAGDGGVSGDDAGPGIEPGPGAGCGCASGEPTGWLLVLGSWIAIARRRTLQSMR